MHIVRGLMAGLAAGAAGTTALNAVTYLDMAVRGRPASTTPEKSVEKLADEAGVDIPGDETTRKHRVEGLGPLMGIMTGVGVGALFGVTRALGLRPNIFLGGILIGGSAMAATNVSMTRLHVTDPATWGLKSWLSDAVPHAAYGFVVAAVLRGLDRTRE
ncbi:hypothetical protein SAMN04489806_1699 [Paramicrobacterium humi]|uniref:DUF1440 domain-containing protein n=1 Tax=Paramicrobacterium humi TaxID=640635 RepID=A0A1H4M000_9MICO|nr:hypothetical protein [Microbacterium humi]SEB75772.1 hypothetical protein SAMN04489806_1699 [Microbacterium humi]